MIKRLDRGKVSVLIEKRYNDSHQPKQHQTIIERE